MKSALTIPRDGFSYHLTNVHHNLNIFIDFSVRPGWSLIPENWGFSSMASLSVQRKDRVAPWFILKVESSLCVGWCAWAADTGHTDNKRTFITYIYIYKL